jgi:hypothetical protein
MDQEDKIEMSIFDKKNRQNTTPGNTYVAVTLSKTARWIKHHIFTVIGIDNDSDQFLMVTPEGIERTSVWYLYADLSANRFKKVSPPLARRHSDGLR